MQEQQLEGSRKNEPERHSSDDELSKEAWTSRACIYADEANEVVAGWKNSDNQATWEKIKRSGGERQSQTTNFIGKDGKHYQVTELDSDLIVKPEISLKIKQPGGKFSHPSQLNQALKEYLSFDQELQDGKLCSELESPERKSKDSYAKSIGDSVEETQGTRITRSADGRSVTIQAMERGKEMGRAEYFLTRDMDASGHPISDEKCIMVARFPDGYTTKSELSAEDFYAIRDAKGQTWKWLGDPKNHRFYIQG